MNKHIGEHIYGYNLHGDSFYIIDFGEVLEYKFDDINNAYYYKTTMCSLSENNLQFRGHLAFSIKDVLYKFIFQHCYEIGTNDFDLLKSRKSTSRWVLDAIVKAKIMLDNIEENKQIDIRSYL